MKPALSVILFTVLSGAGLGALAVTALAELGAYARGASVGWTSPATWAAVAALALVLAGFCASTLHLANPRNAWRSLTRWRTSWLSREALAALVFIPVAGLYIGLHVVEAHPWTVVLAAPVVLLAWVLLYCTAMIYASLKPVRQWHTARVPVVFMLLAHASGALLVVCAAAAGGTAVRVRVAVAAILFVAALVAKLEYWRFVGSPGITLERALGVPQGVAPPVRTGTPPQSVAARLLDAGHSRRTFLTDEFVNRHAPSVMRAMRGVALVAGFAVPLLWLAASAGVLPVPAAAGANWHVGVLAWLASMLGLTAERWLFFAEARHTVRLYHGERSA